MPVFQAKVVNLIGWGRQTSQRKNGWTRNKICLTLGQYEVVVTQLRSGMVNQRANVLGRMVDSSRISVKGVKTFDEGVQCVTDMCWLWSFAIECRVLPYWYKFGKKITGHGVSGQCNGWRPPFGNGIGSADDFVTQAWARYRAIGHARGIDGLIDMIGFSVLPESTIESQATASVQCLENIKSYFAICEGSRFGIKEKPNGSFTKRNGKPASFEYLLKLTLTDVGMTLPPAFERIKRVRNAIVHRGYIRETDSVARYLRAACARRDAHGYVRDSRSGARHPPEICPAPSWLQRRLLALQPIRQCPGKDRVADEEPNTCATTRNQPQLSFPFVLNTLTAP